MKRSLTEKLSAGCLAVAMIAVSGCHTMYGCKDGSCGCSGGSCSIGTPVTSNYPPPPAYAAAVEGTTVRGQNPAAIR